jgi:hypothetical protein
LDEEIREPHMETCSTDSMDCRPAGTRSSRRSGRGHALRRLSAWFAAAALILLGYGCDNCSLEITTNALPNAVVGVYYSFQLSSDCGGDTWFLSSFDLPPGIAFQSDGEFVGYPSHAGVYSFTVGLVDYDSGDEAYRGYTLTVQPPVTPLPTAFPTPTF